MTCACWGLFVPGVGTVTLSSGGFLAWSPACVICAASRSGTRCPPSRCRLYRYRRKSWTSSRTETFLRKRSYAAVDITAEKVELVQCLLHEAAFILKENKTLHMKDEHCLRSGNLFKQLYNIHDCCCNTGTFE